MFIHKKRYFFIIENIKNINLENIKKLNKFNIIYRTNKLKDKKTDLLKFRNICKRKRINFYVANNLQLSKTIKADGLYISAFNKSLKYKHFEKIILTIQVHFSFFTFDFGLHISSISNLLPKM